MAAPTLGGVSLGNVKQIAGTKDANIIPLPFPGEDSDSTDLYDALGITQIITVTGDITGETTAVRTAVSNLAALSDGDQASTVAFATDELGNGVGGNGSINVMVASFDYVWVIPSNRVDYTIKLIQGTAVT